MLPRNVGSGAMLVCAAVLPCRACTNVVTHRLAGDMCSVPVPLLDNNGNPVLGADGEPKYTFRMGELDADVKYKKCQGSMSILDTCGSISIRITATCKSYKKIGTSFQLDEEGNRIVDKTGISSYKVTGCGK